MVLGIGFLLLVSLLVSAGLAAAGHFLGGIFPTVAFVGHVVNFLSRFRDYPFVCNDL